MGPKILERGNPRGRFKKNSGTKRFWSFFKTGFYEGANPFFPMGVKRGGPPKKSLGGHPVTPGKKIPWGGEGKGAQKGTNF